MVNSSLDGSNFTSSHWTELERKEFYDWLIVGCFFVGFSFLVIIIFPIICRPLYGKMKSQLRSWKLKRKQSVHERARQSIPQQPVPASQFISYVEYKKKQGFFQYEVKYVNGAHDDPSDETVASSCFGQETEDGKDFELYPKNFLVNRETNPSKDARVKPTFLDGFMKRNLYIFYDGPFEEEEIPNFWSLIWNEKVSAVVFLSPIGLLQRGQYVRYWKSHNGIFKNDNILVQLLSEEESAFFTVRVFVVTESEPTTEPRIQRCVQFQLNQVVDETLYDPLILLEFRRLIKSYVAKFGGPILVHSARDYLASGLFIAVDALLDFVVSTELVDVARYVNYLNKSVPNMISRVSVYEYIHDIIATRILTGCTSIRMSQFRKVHDQLLKVNPWTRMTGLQQEFKTLCLPTISPPLAREEASLCLQAENFPKMRDRSVRIPDDFRVRLNTSASEKVVSDFVNAVYVPGYESSRSFVVTPWPLDETLEDFWKMIFDIRACAVVMLDRTPKGSEYPVFWPEDETRFGQMNVKEMEKEITESLISRTMKVSRIETAADAFKALASRLQANSLQQQDSIDEAERCGSSVRLFQFLSWPSSSADETFDLSVRHLLDLQRAVRTWTEFNRPSRTDRPRISEEGVVGNEVPPIVVASADGVARVGVFCALDVTQRRVAAEETVDVFHVARLIRMRKRELIPTQNEYNLCYDVLRRITPLTSGSETIC